MNTKHVGDCIAQTSRSEKITQQFMIMMKLQVCLSLIIVPIFLGGGGGRYYSN